LQIGCLPYFYTWFGQCEFTCRSEIISEMYCTRLAEIQDAKTAKKSPSRHHRTNLYLRKEGMYPQSEKNLLNRNISSTCLRNMANFNPIAAEIGSGVRGTPANFNGFRSWLRYCGDVAHRTPTKLCTIFGRLLGVVHGMELRNSRRRRHLYSAGRLSCRVSTHIL